MVAWLGLIRCTKRFSRLWISEAILIKKVVGWLINDTKIGCTEGIHNGTGGNVAQKIWHTR